jgi:hypothetical protein
MKGKRRLFERLSLGALLIVICASLAPMLAANAQESGRVKASQLLKSVVQINTFSCDGQPTPGQAMPIPYREIRCDIASWKGSGSFIDQQGHILTNDHVVRPDRHEGAASADKLGWYLVYQTLDAKELPVAIFYARVVASDAYLDLAVLEPAWTLDGEPIEGGQVEGLPTMPMASEPNTVEIEDALRLLGYPRNHPLVTVSNVNVVGFEPDNNVGELGTAAWIRTDVASAGPGNSGGPAVNDNGEMVGVVSAGSRNTLECSDYNGDGKTDPVSECETAAGGSEYVRPVPEAFDLLMQEGAETPTATVEPTEPPSEETPTPTEETPAPPEESPTEAVEPPAESPTPTATEENVLPPDEPTDTPTAEATDEPEPTPTEQPVGPGENAGTATIIGTLVSADTGDPIARGMIVVLQPGVSVKDYKRGDVGDEAIYTWTTTDARGDFQLPEPVVRGEQYGIWIQAAGYEELYKDNKVLATEDDPAIVDLGVIKVPAQV